MASPKGSGDPRIVRVGWFEYRYHKGRIEYRIPDRGLKWLVDLYLPEEHALLAELEHHPTDEDDEAAA